MRRPFAHSRILWSLISLCCSVHPAALAGSVVRDCSADLKPSSSFPIVRADSLSKFLRSNSPHFWAYMKDADLSGISDYLGAEGIVAGDPHMGNFAPTPVVVGNKKEIAFLDVDFDDAGRGPLVLDLIRYQLSIKAVFPDIKKKDLEQAYIMGLKGQSIAPPMQVQNFLNLSYEQYQSLADEYTAEMTSNKGEPHFKLKPGELEKYNASIKRETIKALFDSTIDTVVDYAIRPAEGQVGGSARGLRIWLLVKTKSNDRLRIMELKEFQPTGMNNYKPQPEPMDWIEEVRAVFWPGYSGETYNLVDLKEDGLFWLRQKQVTLIDVPYSSSKQGKLAYAEGLAIFDANQLGLAHGRQAAAKKLLAAIERDREEFHDAIEAVLADYLSVALKLNGSIQ